MASVELDGVTKRFGSVVAIDDLSLDAADGEFIVLAGASGCGKTTVLRLIAGLEQPDTGTIRIDDRVANDIPPQRRRTSMVFQSHALYPHLNVRDNMAFGLRAGGVTKGEVQAKVEHAASLLGISDLLTRQPSELSGGEQQRVALGKTLASDPAVWLLDEPFSHLDARLRFELRAELASLQRTCGTTTILVTHDLSEAMSLADRIAVIDSGRVQQIGTPREIYEQPANRVVAMSLAQPPMNFLDARVVSIKDSIARLEIPCCALQLDVRVDSQNVVVGSAIELGVRAEDVEIVSSDSVHDNMQQFPASVKRIEVTGADALVHLQVASGQLIARVATSQIDQLSGVVGIALNPDRVHLFDATRALVN